MKKCSAARYVHSIALKLIQPNHPAYHDAIQAGYLALVGVARLRYDSSRGAKLSTYAYHFVRRAVLDEIRSHNRSTATLCGSDDPPEPASQPARPDLIAALASLSEADRLLLSQRFGLDQERDHTIAELATIYHVSTATITRRLARILAGLRARLAS